MDRSSLSVNSTTPVRRALLRNSAVGRQRRFQLSGVRRDPARAAALAYGCERLAVRATGDRNGRAASATVESAAFRREQFRAPDGDAGVGRATRCEVGGSAADGVGRVGGGISPSERLAVVHVLGEREIDRAEIDGAEATRGLTLARIDGGLHDGRGERFDAIERATEPRPQSPRWDPRPLAGTSRSVAVE
jgi:hypothetical protein